jgi:hypothetical protein
MDEGELERCNIYAGGWAAVQFEPGTQGALEYVVWQDWACKGLMEVKRGGTLCGVHLGVDGKGP